METELSRIPSQPRARPYLAVERAKSEEQLIVRLEQLESRAAIPEGDRVYCIAVLDGAPEYRAALSGSGKPEVEVAASAEAKDRLFYLLCFYEFCSEGVVIDREADPHEAFPRDPENRRMFQDACVAVFAGTDPLKRAILSAVRLHHCLAECNMKEGAAPLEQIHTQVSIASTWAEALRCLPYVVPGGTGFPVEYFSGLNRFEQELLLAVGYRFAPAPGHTWESDRAGIERVIEEYSRPAP